MPQETILVTGAAGGVGSTAHTAIAILLEQGHRVRAMVRTLDARADRLRDIGAEIVVSEGLEHGSIGEYLFPADLAFLVYRRGMTPDLGNLSAMWRNHGMTVLEQLLSDRALKCDGGSLCDHRGGACPACIMAPEVACIAGNNLLSRAALRGGVPPGWDEDRAALTGYFRLGLKETQA